MHMVNIMMITMIITRKNDLIIRCNFNEMETKIITRYDDANYIYPM